MACNSSPPAGRAGGGGTDCATLNQTDDRTETVLRTARVVLAAAAEGDSAALARLVNNDTISRKVLKRERPFYRAASSHAQAFCVVSASPDRVEIDLRFPYSRRNGARSHHNEHYQMVFVRSEAGWLLDRDILWSRI